MHGIRSVLIVFFLILGVCSDSRAARRPILITDENRYSFTDITQICSSTMSTACFQKERRRAVVGVVYTDHFVPIWRVPRRKAESCWDISNVKPRVRRKVARVQRYGIQPVDPIPDRPVERPNDPHPTPRAVPTETSPTPKASPTRAPTRTPTRTVTRAPGGQPPALATPQEDPPYYILPIDTVPWPPIEWTPALTPTPPLVLDPSRTPTRAPTPAPGSEGTATRTPLPNPSSTVTRRPTRTPTATSTPRLFTPAPTPPPQETVSVTIPDLNTWESQMKYYGGIHCLNFTNPAMGSEEKLASTYYDSALVYFKIADYTNDPAWISCAQAAEAIYRDKFVLPSIGAVPGYWNFSHGLAQDYLRTGDGSSRQAAVLLSKHAAYANDETPLEWTRDSTYSREVAYTIMSYLNAEDIGEPRRARLSSFVNQAFGHLDQWFVAQNAPYVRPFMAALTAQALITYHERTGDNRVLPALTTAAEWLWQNTWVAEAKSFRYTDRDVESGGRELAPDLNLLIAPLYGWLYHQTGDPRWSARGDQIFSGGVRKAYLVNGKQFNQNYRWSFEYVRWRRLQSQG